MTTDPPSSQNGHDDPLDAAAYDALADLFLGDRRPEPEADDDVPSTTCATEDAASNGSPAAPEATEKKEVTNARPATPAAPVEYLMPGHLPILSGPWVAQYVDRIAHREGPVALVQLRAGACTIELFRPETPTIETVDLADDEPEEQPAPPATIVDGLRRVAPEVRRWVIRTEDAGFDNALLDKQFDSITLLAGADEAAIVAAYCTLKDLISEATAHGRAVPALRFATAGTDAATADAAHRRLAQATRAFLDTPLVRGDHVQRIRPLSVDRIGRWNTLPDVPTLRRWIREVVRGPSRPRGLRPGQPLADPVMDLAGRYAMEAARQAPAPAEPTAPIVEAKPAQELTADAPAPAPPDGPSLTAHLPMLRPLAVRCPQDEGVELAVDGSGRLHVLASGDAAGDIARLMTVSAWARGHARVIALTQPDLIIDLDPEPICHLFTSSAASVRSILDAPVRLHLLVSTTLDGRALWVCSDLN
jgi:hypothetical protein